MSQFLIQLDLNHMERKFGNIKKDRDIPNSLIMLILFCFVIHNSFHVHLYVFIFEKNSNTLSLGYLSISNFKLIRSQA